MKKFRQLSIATCVALTAWVGSVQAAEAVPLAEVRAQAVGSGITLDGSMQAREQTTVSAQANGRVMSLRVKAGDAVKKGELLALIDDRVTRAGVAQTQAGIAQAQAQWRNAQAQFERAQTLVAQGFMGQAALDDARAALRSAKAAREQALAAHHQSALAQGFTRVTAPQAGVVLNTHLEAGDLAGVGAPIATLYAPGALRAVVYVPSSLMDSVRQASSAKVRLNNGQWVTPTLRTILPSADPVSQTVEVRLDLDAAQTAQAIPGEQLQVRFELGQAQRLVVPKQAVVRRGELTAVYVAMGEAEQRRYVLRAVRVGHAVGDDGVEVLAGVRAGDRVALSPVAASQHGMNH
jgi:RND family efflux transporter MFP subunit